jgi:hypothetical protein
MYAISGKYTGIQTLLFVQLIKTVFIKVLHHQQTRLGGIWLQ